MGKAVFFVRKERCRERNGGRERHGFPQNRGKGGRLSGTRRARNFGTRSTLRESDTPGGSDTSRSSGRRKGLALALFEAPEQGTPIADELTAHAPAASLAPRHEALGLDAVTASCAEHFHLGQIGRAEALRIRSCGILRSCRKCDGNGKRFLSPPLPHAAPACRALSRSGSPL